MISVKMIRSKNARNFLDRKIKNLEKSLISYYVLILERRLRKDCVIGMRLLYVKLTS